MAVLTTALQNSWKLNNWLLQAVQTSSSKPLSATWARRKEGDSKPQTSVHSRLASSPCPGHVGVSVGGM